MKIPKNDMEFFYTRGKGPGGQHRNKTCSCVIARHIPTGFEIRVDGRNQHRNKRVAIRRLEKAIEAMLDNQRAEAKKAKRDNAIKNEERVRTYDYSRNLVTDHRTGKTASIKDVLDKGNLEKLR